MLGISVANKCREEILDLSVRAIELAIEVRDEPGAQMGVSAKLVTDNETILSPTRSSQTGCDPSI